MLNSLTQNTCPAGLFSGRRGFTLIEILAAVAVGVILLGILVVGFRAVTDRAKLSHSNSNLRQLWSMILLYSNEHQGSLPPNKGFGSGTWQHHLIRWNEGSNIGDTSRLLAEAPRGGILEIFNSPLNDTNGNLAWGSLGWPTQATTTEVFGRRLFSIEDPARSIALVPRFSDLKDLEGREWQRPSNIQNDVSYHVRGKEAACIMVDGSVVMVTLEDLEEERYIYTYPEFNH